MPGHPLSLAFGKKKDPLLETFGTPTKRVAVESARVKNGERLEYGTDDIDAVIGKLGIAIGNSVAGLSENARLKKTEHILDTWNRYLARAGRTPLFIPREKAIELESIEERKRSVLAGEHINDAAIAHRATHLADTAIAVQKSALVRWVDYLTTRNGDRWMYHPRFQALVFKTITDRASTSLNPIPPLHSGALSDLQDAMLPHLTDTVTGDDGQPRPRTPHETELQTAALRGFSDRYRQAINDIDAEQRAVRESSDAADGKWQTFTRKDVPKIMTLCSKTPLCLKDREWAESYTRDGQQIRLWLTKDRDGRKTLPRIALCLKPQKGKQSHIVEMRGTDGAGQHLEDIPELAAVAQEEANRYENGAGYVQKAQDMLALSSLKKRIAQEKENPTKHVLTTDELRQLYELDRTFTDFGRSGPSRAVELRKGRDTMRDAVGIFGTIATKMEDLTPETKAWIGPLPATLEERAALIRSRIPIFTSFPEGRKTRRTINLTPMQRPAVKGEAAMIGHNRVHVWQNATHMLGGMPETDFERNESFETVTLSVRDLFTPEELQALGTRPPTAKEIFDPKRLEKLGIDHCPPTAVISILANHDATLLPNRWEYIAMEPVTDRGGGPVAFSVGRHDGDLLDLGCVWANPGYGWDLDDRMVFRLRK